MKKETILLTVFLVSTYVSVSSAAVSLYLHSEVGSDWDNLAFSHLAAGEDYYDDSTRLYDSASNPNGTMFTYAESSPDPGTAYLDVWVWADVGPLPEFWLGGSFNITIAGGTVSGPLTYGPSSQIAEGEIEFSTRVGTNYNDAYSFVSEAFEGNSFYPAHVSVVDPQTIYMGGGISMSQPPYPSPDSNYPNYGHVRLARIGVTNVTDIDDLRITHVVFDGTKAPLDADSPDYIFISPEPGSLLLLTVAAIGGLLRRKR